MRGSTLRSAPLCEAFDAGARPASTASRGSGSQSLAARRVLKLQARGWSRRLARCCATASRFNPRLESRLPSATTTISVACSIDSQPAIAGPTAPYPSAVVTAGRCLCVDDVKAVPPNDIEGRANRAHSSGVHREDSGRIRLGIVNIRQCPDKVKALTMS
jgi:hypothetical protein